ncbi:MAG: 2'-5' RNA ligase family protein [Reichenbachiella sp.]|uniref:2'-5' RNA ligase family protein n=1 Tax=Reichenbachiella sp. TaxID=2184521 RepID=UPI003264AF55
MSYPNEYAIIFSLPVNVRDEISEFKRQFGDRYGYFDGVHSIGHITVGNVRIPSGMEEPFFAQLVESISEIESFTFTIDGFDAFADSRTIFAHLEACESFEKIAEAFGQLVTLYHLRKSSRMIHTPHLTIAKGLERRIFNKAYCFEYSFKSYTRTFDAYELTVLRRTSPERPFEVFKKLPLLDLYPVYS